MMTAGCGVDEGGDTEEDDAHDDAAGRRCPSASAAFTLVGSSIGGGLVSLPRAFQDLGPGRALVMLVGAAAATLASLCLIAHAAAATGCASYGELAHAAAPPRRAALCGLATDLSVALVLVGVLASGLIIAHDTASVLMDDLPHRRAAAGAATAAAAAFVAALALPREIGGLRHTAAIATASLATMVVFLAVQHPPHVEVRAGHSPTWWAEEEPSLSNVFAAFPVVVFSMSCQQI
eukprot:gene40453-37910_t